MAAKNIKRVRGEGEARAAAGLPLIFAAAQLQSPKSFNHFCRL
jgi:hypothetical protein